MEIIFKNPHFFWALLVIPVIVIIHFISLKYSKNRTVKFANFIALARVTEKVGISTNYGVLFLRIIIIILIILTITGTSILYKGKVLEADYAIAIDTSSSMLTKDIEPNRLEVAKKITENFVDNLNPIFSSVSIIGFSGTPFIHQKLTKSQAQIKEAINSLQARNIGGTDLGSAIVTGTNILINSEKSKVLILITDGRGNIGLDYRDGVKYANDNNILIFAIGLGTPEGLIETEKNETISLGIDEEQLKDIANLNNGRFYSVESAEDLKNTYIEILNTERKKITLDLTLFLLIATLFLLTLEWTLINTRYKIIP